MNLLTFLTASGISVTADAIKLHFASAQGSSPPLLAFYEGNFKGWQEEQNQQNFRLPFVLGLIQLEDKASWLYAGLFRVNGVEKRNDKDFLYNTTLVEGQDAIVGRVVVQYAKKFRNSYPEFETCGHALEVIELRKKKSKMANFPGYKNILLGKQELDVVVSQCLESWQAALANVSGVYVVVDRSSGKQYVGSAYGEGGIWARWCQYSITGHGEHSRELKTLLTNEGFEHARNFQFSILEVCDIAYSKEQIFPRESHWKKVLHSRVHGFNIN